MPVVLADHAPDGVDAETPTEQVPAFVKTSEAANVNVLPDNDISEQAPVAPLLVIW